MDTVDAVQNDEIPPIPNPLPQHSPPTMERTAGLWGILGYDICAL